MKVTTIDYCCQGFERLRNQNEIILIAYPAPWDTGADICSRLQDDLQYSVPSSIESFDYDEARRAIAEVFEGNMEETELFITEDEYDGPGNLDEGYPQLYCFLQIED